MTTKTVSTKEAATLLGINPHTLHHAFCTRGGYFGVVPHKAPNRFLRWPADKIEALAGITKNDDNEQ